MADFIQEYTIQLILGLILLVGVLRDSLKANSQKNTAEGDSIKQLTGELIETSERQRKENELLRSNLADEKLKNKYLTEKLASHELLEVQHAYFRKKYYDLLDSRDKVEDIVTSGD